MAGIADFRRANQALDAFDNLIDDVFGIVIPNLEAFPEIGMDFLARPSYSLDALVKRERLLEYSQQGFGIREYLVPALRDCERILYFVSKTGVACAVRAFISR